MPPRLLAVVLVCVPLAPDCATGDELPADIRRDVDAVADRLHEALTGIDSDERLRREALWLAIDLRYHALRCALRGVAAEDAARLTELARAMERADLTRDQLAAVRCELTSGTELHRVRGLLMSVVERQYAIFIALQERPPCPPPDPVREKTVEIGEVPRVEAKRGEAIRVRHALRWRNYPEDTLKVKMSASSKDLLVPAEITLNFETHTLDFEYHIRGTAAGTYTITLTPAVGKPVKVTVLVK
jgi:hypothetical protein